MRDKLNKIKDDFLAGLEKVKDKQALFGLEKKYLGRRGELATILRGLASLGEAERKDIGGLANEIKREFQGRISAFRSRLENQESGREFIDVTSPGRKVEGGHLHPVTLVRNDLEDLFSSMGFMVLDGPELESDFYNFTALNIPPYHPARDTQDTFYVDLPGRDNAGELVMRTHTSPMQVRAMRKYGAPLRCIVPGRVFRAEATDAVHEHTFEQMEGLMVGENISLANLIAVMKKLIAGIFKREIETRVRPGYFPFVEPGIELDIKCTICGGRGCPACKHGGWLELLPAGMVHPKVLAYGNIDPEKYSGFAFGLGLTRMAMMRYGIDDIRLFNSGDLRFLEQF